MSDELYAKIDFTKRVRFQTSKKKDKNPHTLDNTDTVTIYDNVVVKGSTPPDLQETTNEDQQQVSGDEVIKNPSWKAAAVFLGLLCFFLLIGLITVISLFTQGNSQWELMAQLQTRNINLTRENDQLQTSNINLTRENGQLQTSNINLTRENGQLQKRYENVTKERDDLQRKFEEYQQVTVGFSDSSYYISSSEKSWQQSREDCLQRGADLVIINSREEVDFLRSIQRRTWVGLTDRETEGTWKWVDGTPVTTSYWARNEPNSGDTDEDCAEIYNFDSEKTLNDVSCDSQKFWICEKSVPPVKLIR